MGGWQRTLQWPRSASSRHAADSPRTSHAAQFLVRRDVLGLYRTITRTINRLCSAWRIFLGFFFTEISLIHEILTPAISCAKRPSGLFPNFAQSWTRRAARACSRSRGTSSSATSPRPTRPAAHACDATHSAQAEIKALLKHGKEQLRKLQTTLRMARGT